MPAELVKDLEMRGHQFKRVLRGPEWSGVGYVQLVAKGSSRKIPEGDHAFNEEDKDTALEWQHLVVDANRLLLWNLFEFREK